MSARHLPPTHEKLEALASGLAGANRGQVALAADLLARLTESEESIRFLCGHCTAEPILETCLDLAARDDATIEIRADAFAVLRNVLGCPEGRAVVCRGLQLQKVLEAPPLTFVQHADDSLRSGHRAELATFVRQAWLGLALSAVVTSQGRVLESPRTLACLQDAVFEFCDYVGDLQACTDALVLLRHLCEWRVQVQMAFQGEEACKLAHLVQWSLKEAVSSRGAGEAPDPQEREAVSRVLHLLSIVGPLQPFRAAFFEVDDDDPEAEQLPESTTLQINARISNLFAAMQRAGATDATVWKALSCVTEIKFVRRCMRAHPEVGEVFMHLLSSLEARDRQLTEQIVSFLQLFFQGATDQFLSTDPIMFENLGRGDGLNQLLTALIESWHDNSDSIHRGNIVAFLADAMFFSTFTDTWQVHERAKELISILFDALLLKGVEGTAGLALGNFVSANGHIDLILDHDHASLSISNVGWFLRRNAPGWDTKMQIYYLWRILRSKKGCRLLRQHAHADLVVSGLLKGIEHATIEDNEVLGLLECFLESSDTRPVVLRGSNPALVLKSSCELLSACDVELCEPSCLMLQALLEATGPGAFVTGQGSSKLISILSRHRHGKEIVDALVPLMQWQPGLVESLTLEYKRTWVSDRIRRHSTPGNTAVLTVSRRELFKCLCDGLRDSALLRNGLHVKFHGEAETGSGDGHRREFFRLATAALTDLKFGLFCSNDGGRTLHPSGTAADAEPECWNTYFEISGKLIALALMHQETLPSARFTLALRKLLLGVGPLAVEDMASVDPVFFRHKVVYLLESKYAEGECPLAIGDLDLVFEDAPQPDVFPDARHELFPGGSNVHVTEENKHYYVELLCDSRMRGSVSRQVEAMLRGIQSIIPEDAWSQIQRLLSPTDLDLLVCGLQEIDFDDWKKNSVCADGVDPDTWDLFWSVVEEFTLQQQRELLEFATGSPGPPVGGFAALPGYGSIGSVQRFTIACNLQSALPVASTCFNTLYCPRYASKAEMSAALLEAIANRNVGGFYEGAVSN